MYEPEIAGYLILCSPLVDHSPGGHAPPGAYAPGYFIPPLRGSFPASPEGTIGNSPGRKPRATHGSTPLHRPALTLRRQLTHPAILCRPYGADPYSKSDFCLSFSDLSRSRAFNFSWSPFLPARKPSRSFFSLLSLGKVWDMARATR